MTQVITPDYIQGDNQSSTPATPPLGSARIYVKNDGDIYILNDQGTESNFSGSVINLNDLSDVVLTSPATNDYLRYDSGTSKWINTTMPTPNVTTMNDFTDVTISSLTTGDVLVYENSQFRNDRNQPAVVAVNTAWTIPNSGGAALDYALVFDGTNYGDSGLVNGTTNYFQTWTTKNGDPDYGVYLITGQLFIHDDGASNDISIFVYETDTTATTLVSSQIIGIWTVNSGVDAYATIYCPVIVQASKHYTIGVTKSSNGNNPDLDYRLTWEKLGHSLS